MGIGLSSGSHHSNKASLRLIGLHWPPQKTIQRQTVHAVQMGQYSTKFLEFCYSDQNLIQEPAICLKHSPLSSFEASKRNQGQIGCKQAKREQNSEFVREHSTLCCYISLMARVLGFQKQSCQRIHPILCNDQCSSVGANFGQVSWETQLFDEGACELKATFHHLLQQFCFIISPFTSGPFSSFFLTCISQIKAAI